MSITEIPLSGKRAAGRVVIIDADDYGLASIHRWHVREKVRPAGNTWGPWAVTTVKGEDGKYAHIAMHTLLTGWPLVDHVNGDGLDNRRTNLRPATIAQNSQNRRSIAASSSQYKGVCWNRSARRWQAEIKLNGKSRYLGVFNLEEDAARAYDTAALAAYGDFAYLNFPEVA